jgi:hypothetical protein
MVCLGQRILMLGHDACCVVVKNALDRLLVSDRTSRDLD